MATKRANAAPKKDAKTTIRQIILTSDTSSTIPTTKKQANVSQTTTLEEFENPETHEIEDRVIPEPAQPFAILPWLRAHWEVIASISGVIFIGIVFFTKLETRVATSEKDIDTLKTNLEKTTAEQIRSTTKIEQLQTSVNRIEDSFLTKSQSRR